jgi:hypothetical protein
MEPHEIYQDCIADIESVKSLFERGHCRDFQLARQRLKDLKAKWTELLHQYKGTEVEGKVNEALGHLPNANTRPDERWSSQLFEARTDFRF